MGVALLRDSKIQEATEVLQQSLAVQAERDKPFDLYFLSMCSLRSGEHSKANSYFDTAEAIVERLRSSMTVDWKNEIGQFAEEAKQLLIRDR